jgi:hypothetical protein
MLHVMQLIGRDRDRNLSESESGYRNSATDVPQGGSSIPSDSVSCELPETSGAGRDNYVICFEETASMSMNLSAHTHHADLVKWQVAI